MPKKEKNGKEVTVYLSSEILAYLDGLVEQGTFRSRSLAVNTILEVGRATYKLPGGLT